MSSINPREQRRFFLIVGAFCLIMGSWKLYRNAFPASPILLGVGGLLIGIELTLPPLANSLFRLWMHFAYWLGKINTFILLSLIYLLLITPIALLKRIFAKGSPYSPEACRQRRSAWFPISPSPSDQQSYINPY